MHDPEGTPDFAQAAAGVGLGRTSAAIRPDYRAWQTCLDRVVREQMTGLAVAGVARGELAVTEDQMDGLSSAHREAMMRAVALERRLVGVAAAFDAEEIEFIVLKGPALAHTIYPDAAWRGFRDIDVLVHTADLERAKEVLASLGFRRDLPEPRPRFDVRFGKAVCHTDEHGLQIDLHRTLVLGPFGLWMNPEELFASTVDFAIGGRTFRRLGNETLFVHACVHAALGWRPPLLLPLRDVVEVAATANIDWDAVAAIAARWKLRGVIQTALEVAAATIPGADFPSSTKPFRAVNVSRRERLALASYTTPRRNLGGGTARATVWAIPGVWQKGAYIRSLVFPKRPFLEARAGPGRRALRLKRWTIPLRWMSGGGRRIKAR